MRLTNFDGTVASHFQLGTGDLKATMQITPEGALQFSVPLQIGSRSATEPYNPVRDGDLMTLGVTNEKLEALFRNLEAAGPSWSGIKCFLHLRFWPSMMEIKPPWVPCLPHPTSTTLRWKSPIP